MSLPKNKRRQAKEKMKQYGEGMGVMSAPVVDEKILESLIMIMDETVIMDEFHHGDHQAELIVIVEKGGTERGKLTGEMEIVKTVEKLNIVRRNESKENLNIGGTFMNEIVRVGTRRRKVDAVLASTNGRNQEIQ